MRRTTSASAGRVTRRCAFSVLCLAISCSTSPEPALDEPPPPPPTRWITIEGNDTGRLETRCASIQLEGLAFSSLGESTVSWRNDTTGDAGDAFHEEYMYRPDVERWEADVPLAPGSNAVRVRMVDGADVATEASTIAERLPGVAISGRVESSPGVPLASVRVTADGPVQASATSGADGRYAIRCLADGTYTLRASSACHEALAGERQLVLAGADLDGQDFLVGALQHAIWGRVYGMLMMGIPGVTIEATDLSTGRVVTTVTPPLVGAFQLDGLYMLCVSAGSFGVRPSRWPSDVFDPALATVTVAETGVRQDFALR